MQQPCERLCAASTNIDYFPTNFIPLDGTLYYVDYECNAYMSEWDFETWGVKYWSSSISAIILKRGEGMILREVTWLAVILRIVVAFVLGGMLGMERGLKQRPAGLRTYMLVCVGACIIMLTNQYVVQVFGAGEVVRMGAQVVSGIGFLGAGTIIVTRHNQIKGLTTAAGLWAAAAVGLATGIGFYEAAIAGAVVIFFTLSVLSNLDEKMHLRTDHFEAYVELPASISLGMLMIALDAAEITVEDVQLDSHRAMSDDSRSFLLMLCTRQRYTRPALMDQISLLLKDADISLPCFRII